MRNVAIPVSRQFPRPPDYFCAIDAENLPFQDDTFDGIWAHLMMHHLPHPASMLSEVMRVLKPGGRFVCFEPAVPRHLRFLFTAEAIHRSSSYGIREDLLSWQEWAAVARTAKMPESALKCYRNPAWQHRLAFRLAGEVVRLLPEPVAISLFPVGLMFDYRKPVA